MGTHISDSKKVTVQEHRISDLKQQIADERYENDRLERIAMSQDEQIADLKRQLSKSIEREQEIERELAGCRSDVSTFRKQATEERARADALAGVLENLVNELGPHYFLKRNDAEALAALKAHRQAREEGE